MRRWRGWYIFLAVVGLLSGIGLALWYGWVVNPVTYTDMSISDLHPLYQREFLLLVSEAYALDGDLDTARARLALLALPDPVTAIADLAEEEIVWNAPLAHIRALARLAVALGAQRDALLPYAFVDDAP